MITVTLQQARNIQLAALGLLPPPSNMATKASVLEIIQSLSVLQIDTIHVINRSPYLVLYSRIGNFKIDWVTELLAERKLFEYWSHEACFLPIEDYPLYRTMIRSKTARAFHWSKEWIHANKKDALRVMKHIEQYGPSMSSHFKNSKKAPGGWWNWKVEKMALDMLYTQGKLTIVGRKNFQRLYEITEKAIPQKYYEERIPLTNVYETFIERTIKHLGITKKSWVHDYFRLKKTVAYPVFEKLLKKKLFVEVQVDGFDDPFYVHKDNATLVQDVLAGNLIATHITFLSPFDPLVWDRKRVHELFSFDYQIESYTPSVKRKYGYFTLPVLYKGRIIGRMDAKMHRAESLFEVKSWHFEKNVALDATSAKELVATLSSFATWHGAKRITISNVFPDSFSQLLTQFL